MRRWVLWCVCTLAVAGCGRSSMPAPGYDGTVPSPAAQEVIGTLRGRTLTVGTGGAVGTGDWTVDGFAVVPNPATGKGPVVLLKAADGTLAYLPVDTDADVADLARRVTGQPPAGLPTNPPGARYLDWAGPPVQK